MQKASTGALRVLLNAHPATNPLYNVCPSISFFVYYESLRTENSCLQHLILVISRYIWYK